ncbi:MAG: DUF2752 domain-containing protein [Flavobacteriaceae bacterium]|nr:DUF2752 domain-containing protein [Flavobacteriaceae bacterium]
MNLKTYFAQSNFRKYSSLLILVLIILYITLGGSHIPHFCIFEKVLNLKCSFCDLTKSIEQLFIGNFLNALSINFLSYALIVFLVSRYLLFEINKLKYVEVFDKLFLFLCVVQFIIVNV